jgi:hypothetical protein
LKRVNKLFNEKLHLFILVHGLQGHSIDMRYLRNSICESCTRSVVMVSQSNQNNTETVEIETMGQNLANEIMMFMMDWNEGKSFEK